jgi:hypothetical protein
MSVRIALTPTCGRWLGSSGLFRSASLDAPGKYEARRIPMTYCEPGPVARRPLVCWRNKERSSDGETREAVRALWPDDPK